jgi:hypothetical protein
MSQLTALSKAVNDARADPEPGSDLSDAQEMVRTAIEHAQTLCLICANLVRYPPLPLRSLDWRA